MNGEYMVSLFVTKNLEVTVKTVMVREGFDSRDIVIMENSASIPAVFRQEQGVIADFGMTMLSTMPLEESNRHPRHTTTKDWHRRSPTSR